MGRALDIRTKSYTEMQYLHELTRPRKLHRRCTETMPLQAHRAKAPDPASLL